MITTNLLVSNRHTLPMTVVVNKIFYIIDQYYLHVVYAYSHMHACEYFLIAAML